VTVAITVVCADRVDQEQGKRHIRTTKGRVRPVIERLATYTRETRRIDLRNRASGEALAAQLGHDGIERLTGGIWERRSTDVGAYLVLITERLEPLHGGAGIYHSRSRPGGDAVAHVDLRCRWCGTQVRAHVADVVQLLSKAADAGMTTLALSAIATRVAPTT
jgi:hypothetical protein